MTNKYTPAPWFYDECDIFNEKGEHIACTDGFHKSDLVNEANAMLIAAAPDLLDALIEIKDFVMTCCEQDELLIKGFAFEKARAAIAKAMGKTECN